jgi:signal peptidase II
MPKSNYKLLAALYATFVLIVDQVSKWWILENVLSPERPFIEVTSFFNLVMVWNTGVSFGLFSQHNQPLILIAVASIIVIILLIWLMKNDSKLVAIALGLVIGGAVGNIIDRFRYGAVADFLDVHIGGYHWPAFNIADSSIFIGVVLLASSGMFTPSHQKGNNV